MSVGGRLFSRFGSLRALSRYSEADPQLIVFSPRRRAVRTREVLFGSEALPWQRESEGSEAPEKPSRQAAGAKQSRGPQGRRG